MEETAEYGRSADRNFLNMEIIFPHEGFPRSGQILPAPGRNVTEGDKERCSCHRR